MTSATPRRLAAAALATTALALGSLATAAPASAAVFTCTDFVSDDAELRICASLYSPAAGTYAAHGYTIELHEYLRRHVITVTLQRQNATGGWDVVDSEGGYGVEEARADTGPNAVSGTLRACATGGLEGFEQGTVCTG